MIQSIKLGLDGGGGGGGGYVSPNIDRFEQGVANGAFNRAGANPATAQYNYNPNQSYGDPNTQMTYHSPGGDGSPGGYASGQQHYLEPLAGEGSWGRNASGTRNGVVARSGVNQSTNQPLDTNKANYGMPPMRGGSTSSSTAKTGGQQDDPYAKYDFSNVGTPLTGPNAVGYAAQGYDFSPINQAIEGYRTPAQLTQTYSGSTYNPYQYNFDNLPSEYTNTAYQSGASDINRAGSNSLAQLQESLGTRKPGLLANAAENSQRNTNKNLLGLNTNLRLNEINQNLATQQAQQKAQAGENLGAANFNAGEGYKGYESRANLEKANADNIFRNLGALASTGQQRIGTEAGLVKDQQATQDQALQYLMNLYQAATGQANQSAALDNQARQASAAQIGGLGSLAAGVGGLAAFL